MKYQVIAEHNRLDEVLATLPFTPSQITRRCPGFILEDPPAQLVQALERNPHIRAIGDADIVPTTDGTVVQPGCGMALSRLVRDNGIETGSYEYGRDGTGVWVYVIDMGSAQPEHPEFVAQTAAQIYGDGSTTRHAISCSSLAVGQTVGVARGAYLGMVGSVTTSGYLTLAADEIIAHHQAHGGPSVVSISISWDGLDVVDAVAVDLVAAGILVCASAGNSADAEVTSSPARVPEVLTVGGYFKPYEVNGASGSKVDVFAKSDDVPIADSLRYELIREDEFSAYPPGYYQGFGTSYAAPQAAGVCALILQEEPLLTPAELHQRVQDYSDTSVTLTNALAGTISRILRIPPALRTGKIHSLTWSAASTQFNSLGLVTEVGAPKVITAPDWVDQSGAPASLPVLADGDASTYLTTTPIDPITREPESTGDPSTEGGGDSPTPQSGEPEPGSEGSWDRVNVEPINERPPPEDPR